MGKTIGVTELQKKFLIVLDEVVQQQVPYILTRGSRPQAALIPYEQYEKLVQGNESRILDHIDHALARMTKINARYSDAEVEADLRQTTKVVRAHK
ncbi:MAG: type II toxin-antitoxin system Phd/YefM family antitoxin [Deltaproteobacteria bacterium]|nr:type II toxin-antitoxin system Phd/YefM family antitoxin [Deltaproteobacteria bacterium]